MKSFFKPHFLTLFFIIAVAGLLVPSVTEAGIVPCGNIGMQECTVCNLADLGNKLMDTFVSLAYLVAAFLFVNAGVLYIMSPSNPGNIARAHKIFTNTLFGTIIVVASWLLVDAIMILGFAGGGLSDMFNGVAWSEILCSGLTDAPAGAAPSGIGTGVSIQPDVQRGSAPVAGAPAGALPSFGTMGTDETRTKFEFYGSIYESAPGRTTFDGIQQHTVNGAVTLMAGASEAGVPKSQITVTGGTETGHAEGVYSHGEGYKLDFDDTPGMDSYITSNFTRDGSRNGDARYTGEINGRPVELVRESNHWDVTFF